MAQIRPNVVKKVKKQASPAGFFHIFHVEYLLKPKVVVLETAECMFKVNIARNVTFEER